MESGSELLIVQKTGDNNTDTEQDEWGDSGGDLSKPNNEIGIDIKNDLLLNNVPTEGLDFEIMPIKPERPQKEMKNETVEVVSLEESMQDLSDPRYRLFGHGTSSVQAANSIMDQGLFVGNHTGLDSYFLNLSQAEGLKSNLDSWYHRDAKQIILFRVPIKYTFPFPGFWKGGYGVFYHNDPNKQGRGIYESAYIYGYYDANEGTVHKNPNYQGNLDNPDDVKYMQTVYDGIKSTHLKTLPENERQDWEDSRKALYDYKP